MENLNTLIGIAGLILLAFYFFRYKKVKKYQKLGREVKGRVINVVLKHSKNGNRYYYPTVRFTLPDGTWVTETYSDGTFPATFKKDEYVNILYDPEDTSSFIIISEKHKHIDRTFLVIGVLMLFYSLYCFIK